MTELKKILLEKLDYYIVSTLFTASGLREVTNNASKQNIQDIVNAYLDSLPPEYSADLAPRDIAALSEELTAEGMELYTMYANDAALLADRKYELDIIVEQRVQEQDPMWRDITDASRMTQAEKDYEDFIAGQAELRELLGDDTNAANIKAAIGSIMAGDFYGIAGNPAIGRRGLGMSNTVPLFTFGIETNLYSDPTITNAGTTWLQDVQLALVELGLIGQYMGEGDDRTLYAVNQLDDITLAGMRDLMTTLNRSGQYLPTGSQIIKDFTDLGLDTAMLEAALTGESGDVVNVFNTVASSPEGKQLFHNYLLTGAQKMIADKRRTGMDTQIILTPSYDARIAEAKSQWRSITGTMMNPYLAAVAAQDIANIYEEVQLSEGEYMSPYAAAADTYIKSQKERIKGDNVDAIYKPYSDPMTTIQQKIGEAISKMSIKDNEEFVSGTVQKSYGTNLWNLLSSLG
jgi:hypothetical protein